MIDQLLKMASASGKPVQLHMQQEDRGHVRVRIGDEHGCCGSRADFTGHDLVSPLTDALRAVSPQDYLSHVASELLLCMNHRSCFLLREEPFAGHHAMVADLIAAAKKLSDAWRAKFQAEQKEVQAKRKQAAQRDVQGNPVGENVTWTVIQCSHGVEKGCDRPCQCGHACKTHDALAGCTEKDCPCGGFVEGSFP